MKLKDGVLLYHGSYACVDNIELGQCAAGKDFGKIANDTTNPVITTYLNGLYGDVKSDKAVNFAIEQLLPDHLFD